MIAVKLSSPESEGFRSHAENLQPELLHLYLSHLWVPQEILFGEKVHLEGKGKQCVNAALWKRICAAATLELRPKEEERHTQGQRLHGPRAGVWEEIFKTLSRENSIMNPAMLLSFYVKSWPILFYPPSHLPLLPGLF